MQNINNLKRFPFKVLVVMPAIILGFLLWKYGVNIPFMDEWDTPGMDLLQFNLGQLTLERLMRQHNESRKFFPRLLFIYLSQFVNWNPRYGMLISWLLSILTAANIYYLSKLTLKSSVRDRLIYIFIACCLIFSPLQWENWLFGLQMITFVPITAITSALVIIFTPLPLILKLLVSGVLATVATFSFANGIISWVIIFPALLLVSGPKRQSRLTTICAWLLLCGFNVAVYFHQYHRPGIHPSHLDALSRPFKSLAYYLSFVGSPLGMHQLWLNQILGGISCCFTLLIIWYVLRHKHCPQLLLRLTPWLSILGYTVVSGVLTTAGRVGFGVTQSLSLRYVTFSTYGMVALLYIGVVIYGEVASSLMFSHTEYVKVSRTILVTLLVMLLPLYFGNFRLGVQAMASSNQNRLYGKSCLTLINVLPEEDCIKSRIYPDVAHVKARANELDRLGLMQPSLILSDRLQDFSRENWSEVRYGFFDSFQQGTDGNYIASGWAVLPRPGTPAHAVILAYQTKDGSDHPLAIIKTELERKDVAQVTGKSNYLYSGWRRILLPEQIPPEAISFSAWSFDTNLARAFKLEPRQPYGK